MVLAMLLLTGPAATGGRRCKGTKEMYRGKCRYPAEIRRMKRARRRRLPAERPPVSKISGLQWVAIPGGKFMMGSSSGSADEKPVHRVTVRGFSMLRTEVTNVQYRACIKAGKCSLPEWAKPGGKYNLKSGTDKRYRGFTGNNQPVVGVSWKDAGAFCRWAGGRLPSEAEWEFAARSGGRAQKYPWGDTAANCLRVVMDHGGNGCGRKRTWPVCSKKAGNTAHGLCDMAGNAWEWIEDCWHERYIGAPTDGSAWTRNCSDPYQVRRGGGWDNAGLMRAAYRSHNAHGPRHNNVGVRCAR